CPDLRLQRQFIPVTILSDYTLTQHNERRNIAPIYSLYSPVQNLLSRVKRYVSPLFYFALPIHERTAAPNSYDLRDNTLRITSQRRSEHVRIIHEARQSAANT